MSEPDELDFDIRDFVDDDCVWPLRSYCARSALFEASSALIDSWTLFEESRALIAGSRPLIDVFRDIFGAEDDEDKFVAAFGFDMELVVFDLDSDVVDMEHVVGKFEDD